MAQGFQVFCVESQNNFCTEFADNLRRRFSLFTGCLVLKGFQILGIAFQVNNIVPCLADFAMQITHQIIHSPQHEVGRNSVSRRIIFSQLRAVSRL